MVRCIGSAHWELVFVMAPSSQEGEPPTNPVRFRRKAAWRLGRLPAAREQGRKLSIAENRPERVAQARAQIAAREGGPCAAAVDAGNSRLVLGRSDMAGLQGWALM